MAFLAKRLRFQPQASFRSRRAGSGTRSVIVLIAAAVLLAACSIGPAEEVTDTTPEGAPEGNGVVAEEPAAETDQEKAAEGAAFPMTLTDDSGRQVTIPAEPQRIVVVAPSHTEVLFAIGRGDRVVGIDDFTDFPPEVEEIPRVGGVFDPNIERMVELEPDLFLSIAGAEDIADRLQEFGIPGLIIQPADFEDILNRILLLGRISGAADEAEQLVAEMTERVDAVKMAVADTTPVSVFYETWHDPLYTVGPGSFIHDLIGLAGGANIAHDAAGPWPEISLEAVVERDPEVIVTTFVDSYEQLQNDERSGWGGISAVTEGRVYLIDENLISRPGPRIVEGLESLARFFHPAKFK